MPHDRSVASRIQTRDGATMVWIPAGEFWMGSPTGVGKDDEHPRHRVWVDAFCIDEHAVTFDQYDRFCAATGRPQANDEGFVLRRCFDGAGTN